MMIEIFAIIIGGSISIGLIIAIVRKNIREENKIYKSKAIEVRKTKKEVRPLFAKDDEPDITQYKYKNITIDYRTAPYSMEMRYFVMNGHYCEEVTKTLEEAIKWIDYNLDIPKILE